MDDYETFAFFGEFLQGGLLAIGHIEWGQLEHDEGLVSGEVAVIDQAGIVGKIQGKMIAGGDLREIRPGGGDHFRVIGDTGGYDQDTEGFPGGGRSRGSSRSKSR